MRVVCTYSIYTLNVNEHFVIVSGLAQSPFYEILEYKTIIPMHTVLLTGSIIYGSIWSDLHLQFIKC